MDQLQVFAQPRHSVVSGDGLVAYAVTGGGRLLRIDVTSGTSTELAPDPPFLGAAYRGIPPATTIAAAGSVMSLAGSGLSRTRQLTFCGQPVPFQIQTVNLELVQFQVPWDAPEGPCQVVVQNDSPFEHGLNLEVRKLDPQFVGYPTAFLEHQGFAGPVTEGSPTHPGETIVAYMTGLGPVGASGQLTMPGFACRFDGVPGTVSYAGLAPGYTGFYQVNVPVPELSPRLISLACGWDVEALSSFTTVWVGTTQ